MQLQRPAILFPLFASLTSLPGIGPRLASIMEKRIGKTIIELLRHAPTNVIDRRARPAISAIQSGQLVTIDAVITEQDIAPAKTSRPSRIIVETDTGSVELVFFRADPSYIRRALPIGERRLISGTAELFQGRVQIAHPDYILPTDKADELPLFEPIYPLSAGLKGKVLRKAIETSLARLTPLPEWATDIISAQNWPSFDEAMRSLHHPQSDRDISANAPARERLAFDELLANQVALAMIRHDTSLQGAGNRFQGDGRLRDSLTKALPFTLTEGQQSALRDIYADQEQEGRMLRLVQGDVGSGKTIIALLAMLHVVECNNQAAMLAPTEILARQHFKTISALCAPLNIRVELLVSQMKRSERQRILADLEAGEVAIIIGTHALLSDDVHFNQLGLAVVDEQHRFGVRQRVLLSEKGAACDVLVMTATPIPRTLAMTAYGDLKSSIITGKPAGRKPIETALISLERIAEIVEKLRLQIAQGHRVYWICPLVEESDKSDITAAEDRFRHLQNLLAEANPQLVHGRMKTDEKEAAMNAFQTGEAQLLVATTVIEVGVDVPEASIIIIEHAERFGLAQLHQLRGRVGRGERQSACLLAYQGPLSETATARLKIMRESNDGFVLAEEDLRLRGPGEILGQRQSGMPEFSLVDLAAHGHLLPLAREAADRIIARDPDLSSEASAPLRLLLSLFEKDNAVQFLTSG